jgi:hypothetical protein
MNTLFGNRISDAVHQFEPITLSEMEAVQLMRRIDSKFVFPVQKLPVLLDLALNNFRMVEIEGYREQIYETTYYDTDDYVMYSSHHNGRMDRCKVRIRKYIYSKQEFLEVKRKNNKGETIKNRIGKHDRIHEIGSERNSVFLGKYTPYDADDLIPMMGNKFIRLTLVNRNFRERITLDYNLQFFDLQNGNECSKPGICIAEVKRDKDDRKSNFIDLINQLKIAPMGFSKYAVGMALLNNNLKSNLFKPRIRAIEKINAYSF